MHIKFIVKRTYFIYIYVCVYVYIYISFEQMIVKKYCLKNQIMLLLFFFRAKGYLHCLQMLIFLRFKVKVYIEDVFLYFCIQLH